MRLHLTWMFSGLFQKDLFKWSWKFGAKFSQTKLLSRLSHKVYCLLSSPVMLPKFMNYTPPPTAPFLPSSVCRGRTCSFSWEVVLGNCGGTSQRFWSRAQELNSREIRTRLKWKRSEGRFCKFNLFAFLVLPSELNYPVHVLNSLGSLWAVNNALVFYYSFNYHSSTHGKRQARRIIHWKDSQRMKFMRTKINR